MTAANDGGSASSTSPQTAVVMGPTPPTPPSAPVSAAPPVISGTPTVGNTLTVSDGAGTGERRATASSGSATAFRSRARRPVLHRQCGRSGPLDHRHRHRIGRHLEQLRHNRSGDRRDRQPTELPEANRAAERSGSRPDLARSDAAERSAVAAAIRRSQLPHRQLLPVGWMGDPRGLRLLQTARHSLARPAS